jgi:hypothetical protein
MNDVTELTQTIIDNWWKMRAMAINMGVLIEDRLIAEGLMTEDQRAIIPRRLRPQSAKINNAQR